MESREIAGLAKKIEEKDRAVKEIVKLPGFFIKFRLLTSNSLSKSAKSVTKLKKRKWMPH